MADLLIRAGFNDHLVVSDLLARGAGLPFPELHPPIDQLVADAQVALARPVLARATRDAGIPYIVDPATIYLQTGAAPSDPWSCLPFGQVEPLRADQVGRQRLVEQTIEFELDQGATVVVPPYLYAASPSDRWFELSLEFLEEASEFLRRSGVRQPVLPILCGQLQSLGAPEHWNSGLERFAARSKSFGWTSAAMCLSPAGAGDDGYAKIRRLFDSALHLKAHGMEVIAWRQGIYGPALVASGIDGYECGLGWGERTKLADQQRARRAQGDSRWGGGPGIFLETLGRSMPRPGAAVLLSNRAMRPKVMCEDDGCCSSPTVTLSRPREHAARARRRMLDQIENQPAVRWRLNHVAREARSAATLAIQANAVLQAAGARMQFGFGNLLALEQVASELAERLVPRRTA